MKREDTIITTIATALLAALVLVLAGCSGPQAPATVDVNGVLWRIQQVSFDGYPHGLRGITHCNTKTIEVKALDDNPQETLMHELSHAMVCLDASKDFDVNNMYYNSLTNDEHEGIYKYAEMWGSLLQRNPELAAYLGTTK